MFIVSVKMTKKRFAVILLAAVVLVGGFILSKGMISKAIARNAPPPGRNPSPAKMAAGIRNAGDGEIVGFLKRLGWDVVPAPVQIQKTQMPEAFDDAFLNYNIIQTLQGFDLKKYHGKILERRTYEVNNYPGYPKEAIHADVFLYKGRIVAGDIVNIRLSGFIHGLNIRPESTSP